MTDKKAHKAKDPNRKHYFTTVPNSEVDGIFADIARKNAEISVWKKGQNEKNVEAYQIVEYKAGMRKLVIEKVGGLLSKFTSSARLLNENILFKISLGKTHYFSTSTLVKDPTSKFYFLNLTGEIYRSQQRSNYRLSAGPHISVQIKIDGSVFEALDLSAGGTSAIIPESDRSRFAKGMEFSDCTLRFNKKNYSIPLMKIVAIWEQKDRHDNVLPELRIGIQFANLDKETEEKLVLEINSEARGEEIRKKFNMGS